MSCSDRRNKMYRDLERVKALAQVTANLSKVNQKVYEL